jgi:hypothetical protein
VILANSESPGRGKSAKDMAYSTGIDGFGLRWQGEAVMFQQASVVHVDGR